MTGKLLLAGAAAVLTAAPALAEAPRPWMDTRLSPEQRADLLLSQMTEDQQLGLVHGVFPAIMKKMPPGALHSAGFVPGVPWLGIPDLRESDASLGVANAGRVNDDAVALPSGLALAASFNPVLAWNAGAMIGKETRQKGFNVLLAGGVDLVRDPGNGRNFEYAGEDPLLAGTMVGQSVAGIQSNHIVSTTKHYALNDQETGRGSLNAIIDPAALRESDLLAFELVIEQGKPGSVMCAYNKVNGAYSCENAPLLNQTLKTDWGWKGWVMSDWGAVHSTVPAAMAGLDQESGEQLDKQVYFGAPLKAAVASGAVPDARLHDMARRILWGMFSTGLMDNPVQPGGLDTAADAPVAERAAEQGIVLLKNARGLLPLDGVHRIAVIGGHADIGVLSGGGSSQVIPNGSVKFPAPKWAPSWSAGVVYHPSPPLSALRARLGGTEIRFDDGRDPGRAAAAARAADVAIVFATQWTTEAADVPLNLPDGQDALISAVAAANPRTIVVLETGGPVLMPWLDQVGAVVEAWYPGQRGGEAIANVLTGEVNPSGRLPVSFPRRTEDLPRPEIVGMAAARAEGASPAAASNLEVHYLEGADVGYRWYERTGRRPLFPFGYGLSYTRFHYGGLQIEGGPTLTVSFDVTNTGARPGVETPQVYAVAPGRTHRLIGWSKVSLEPGETRRVSVTADPRLLSSFDTAAHVWRVGPGPYDVAVGAYAGDAELTGQGEVAPALVKP